MSRSAILVLLLLACALGAKHLQAQVRRCTTTDGTLVYTDRKCEDGDGGGEGSGGEQRAHGGGFVGVPAWHAARFRARPSMLCAKTHNPA